MTLDVQNICMSNQGRFTSVNQLNRAEKLSADLSFNF